MRTNPKTIRLAKIRYYIREAIKWHRVDKGMPEFYTSENYKKSRVVENPKIGDYPYYVASDRAIRDIAEKIHDLMDENKVINIRIDDQELDMLNCGASLSRLTDNVFLKVYHSNYKEKKEEKI